MPSKYDVPALRRAYSILQLIATTPRQLKLMDFAYRLSIHKSSVFSLLKTMEELNWIVREKGDTYSLGSACGFLGGAYFRHYDLVSVFQREAKDVSDRLEETIQLAKLEGGEVFYLAKVEANTRVKVISEPGMKYPAYATALGKALLSEHSLEELRAVFPEDKLSSLTSFTIPTFQLLAEGMAQIRRQGYAEEIQESVIGFRCVAAPIRNEQGKIIAAVSCTLPLHQWEDKQHRVIEEIKQLASKCSLSYIGFSKNN